MTPARLRHLALLAVFVDPVQRDRTAIVSRIANAVGTAERQFQRMLGADRIDAYRADWSAAAATYDMLVEPARPAVLTRFRPTRSTTKVI